MLSKHDSRHAPSNNHAHHAIAFREREGGGGLGGGFYACISTSGWIEQDEKMTPSSGYSELFFFLHFFFFKANSATIVCVIDWSVYIILDLLITKKDLIF